MFKTFRRLQWKLTLSYSAVTVGSLFVVVLILGYLLFSKAFVPIEIYNRVLTPDVRRQNFSDTRGDLLREAFVAPELT